MSWPQTFLADAGKGAAELAYDRPSPKLLAFMRKHYGAARAAAGFTAENA